MFKKILVPTDASEYSRRALEKALELARLVNAEIFLLHVIYTPEFFWGFNSPYGEPKSVDELKHNAELTLDSTMKDLKIDVPLHKILEEGHPVKIIEKEAESLGIDIIIMGTHGYGSFAGSVMGSVSQRVIHNVKCPVMVVK
jgi:nucleotide-binding universal stress UspA family protein